LYASRPRGSGSLRANPLFSVPFFFFWSSPHFRSLTAKSLQTSQSPGLIEKCVHRPLIGSTLLPLFFFFFFLKHPNSAYPPRPAVSFFMAYLPFFAAVGFEALRAFFGLCSRRCCNVLILVPCFDAGARSERDTAAVPLRWAP